MKKTPSLFLIALLSISSFAQENKSLETLYKSLVEKISAASSEAIPYPIELKISALDRPAKRSYLGIGSPMPVNGTIYTLCLDKAPELDLKSGHVKLRGHSIYYQRIIGGTPLGRAQQENSQIVELSDKTKVYEIQSALISAEYCRKSALEKSSDGKSTVTHGDGKQKMIIETEDSKQQPPSVLRPLWPENKIFRASRPISP